MPTGKWVKFTSLVSTHLFGALFLETFWIVTKNNETTKISIISLYSIQGSTNSIHNILEVWKFVSVYGYNLSNVNICIRLFPAPTISFCPLSALVSLRFCSVFTMNLFRGKWYFSLNCIRSQCNNYFKQYEQ